MEENEDIGISSVEETQKPEKSELETLREKYQYALADIQNIKKRHEREKWDVIRNANRELLVDFLGIRDDMELALRSDGDVGSLKKGFEMILGKMDKLLGDEGCEKLDTKVGDDFDHRFHNAILAEEKEGVESGKISSVHKDGWLLGKSLLRAADVCVAK